jgi:molybdopterin molybdotransferase
MNTAAQSAGVLGFEEAYEIVREQCGRILQAGLAAGEEVLLLQSLGRVLAEPVLADRDFPPFPRSTRDGFAVRAEDLRNGALEHKASQNEAMTLRVVGQIRAGDSYDLPVGPGEAVEIMTGAAVPAGANAVVMVEYTERKISEINHEGHEGTQREGSTDLTDDDAILDIMGAKREKIERRTEELVEILRAVDAGENIVPAGAEAVLGQELLPRGTRMGAAQIAMAAAAGQGRVNVYRRPRVAILSTGDELVDVVEKPGASQIRNSNSYSLAALVAAHGGEPVQLPIAPDEEGKLTELIQEGLKADMLLLSGGVSMGKFDLVELALKNLGAQFFFTGAMIQPGKPIVFGEVVQLQGLKPGTNQDSDGTAKARALIRTEIRPVRTENGHERTETGSVRTEIGAERALPTETQQGIQVGVPFFGHPGNPVSVMVTFELFARPVLEALSGMEPARLKSAQARMKKEFKTKTGLTRFLPAILDGGLYDAAVEIVPWQGSGDMLAAARANCYLVVPPDREKLAAGDMVTVVMR